MTTRLFAVCIAVCLLIASNGVVRAAVTDVERVHASADMYWSEPPSCLTTDATDTPECLQALFNLGNAFVVSKQYDAALYRYTQILRYQQFGGVYCNRGVVLLKQGKVRAARHDFVRATLLNPEWHESWYNLAAVDLHERHYARALRFVNRAIALKHDLPQYFELRADIYRLLRQQRNAAADHRRAFTMRASVVKQEEAREHAFVE